MKRIIYILSFASIMAASCVERIGTYESFDDDHELLVESFLNPDSPVEAAISLNDAFNISPELSIPEQAELELMGTGLQGSNLRFSYRGSSNTYVLRNQQFRPVVGGEYQIRAFVPGQDVDTIFAQTSIPEEVNIAEAYYNNVEINPENEAHDYFMDLTIKLNEEELGASWLHIIPTYRTNTSDDNLKFQIVDILNNKNAVSTFYLEEGVFVDITKFSGSEFTIRVSTLIPLKSGTLLKQIQFETRSATKDYYKYLRTRARQIESSEAAYSSPITDFSNIENGLGVFAGYSISTHSIKF